MIRGSSVAPSSLRRSRATCPSTRAIERRPVAPLNSLRYLVTGEHTRGVLDEQDQQPVFGVGQIDQIAIDRPQFAFDEVENAMVEGADAGAETWLPSSEETRGAS